MELQQQAYPLVAYSYEMRNHSAKGFLEIFLLSAFLLKSYAGVGVLPPFPLRSIAQVVGAFIFYALLNIYAFNTLIGTGRHLSQKFFTKDDPREPRLLFTEALINSADGFFRGNQPNRVGDSVPLSYYNIETLSGSQLLELYKQLFPGDLLRLPQPEVPQLT